MFVTDNSGRGDMRKFMGGILSAILAAMMVVPVCAQTTARKAPPPKAPLVAVHVSGSERFKEQEIIIATGLTVGSTVGPSEFQEAANRLVSSGAFESVEYKFAPAGTGYSLTFKVVDNTGFMSISYDNFIWFTEKELNDAVQKRVPLYNGAIAPAGEMLDQVTEALQAYIVEHGITGEVRFEQIGQLGKSIDGGMFSIEGPTIHIKQVKFPGASEPELSAIEKISQQLTKMPYRRSLTAPFAELNLLPVYAEHGYLKAEFASPQLELIDKNPNDPSIALTIPVTPGPQYTMSAFEWTGVKAFSADTIIKTVKLRPTVIANGIQLKKDIESVVALYGTKGYIKASVKPEATFDDEKRLVSFNMQVTEGEVYYFGSVEISGLDKQTNTRLREAWKLREGEPFDTSYEKKYLDSIRSLLPPNVSIASDKQVSDKSHTVDVDLRFQIHADKVIR